ncbi:MAG: response regulator [Candidatus Coatesbacteria bacterium]|nr:response regulator [Candidatus Coatesbacteria bacterium]
MSETTDRVGRRGSRRKRILIVDDEQTLRDVWQEALQDEGYEVETAESPEHAFLILESDEFDLVLLDEVFKTGPYDGLDTFREIRKRFCSVAVVMMTGYMDVEDNVARAVEEGAYHHVIKKPSTLAEITEIVSDCLLIQQEN